MNKYSRHIILSYCMILQAPIAMAQLTAASFERYTVQQGISDNNVFCITQDDQGYIWFGTENGLNRFDGSTFQTYYHEKDSFTIPGNHIIELKRAGLHEILVLTQKGLHCLNTYTMLRKTYVLPSSERSATTQNRLVDVVKLQNGAFALSTSIGFYVMKPDASLVFNFNRVKAGGQRNDITNYGTNIFQLPDSNALLFTRREGVSLYVPATNKFIRYKTALPGKWAVFDPPEEEWLIRYQADANRFMMVHRLKDSITYYNAVSDQKKVSVVPAAIHDELSADSKVFPLTDSTFALTSGRSGFYTFHLNKHTGAITFNEGKELAAYRCNYVFSDKEQRLWVGTTLGLLCEKKEKPLFSSFMLNNDPSGGYALFYTLLRYKQHVYIGRSTPYPSLTIVDTSTMKVVGTLAFPAGDLSSNQLPSIQCYYPDTLWLGTNDGIIWLDTKSYNYGNVVLPEALKGRRIALYPAMKNGDTWIVSPWDGVVAKYNIHGREFTCYTGATNPALPFDRVKQVAYDAYGDAWISGHGLARWNYKEGRFDTLIVRYGGLNKDEDNILSICADSKGSLWLHSFENGLQEYRIREKRFVNHSWTDGFSSNALVNLSHKEINGKIWFSTPSNQIGNINLQTKKFNIYGRKDGLPEERPSARFIFYDETARTCYALTSNYLEKFSPEKEPVDAPHQVLIEQVAAPDTLLFYPKDTIRFPYNRNDISIRFTLVNYSNTSSYRFFYRLNDTKTWTPLRNQRSINMTSLSPGKYSLYIKAVGREQDGHVRRLVIIIDPPFWNTWWFMTLLLLLIAGAVFAVLKWREMILRKAAAVKLKAQEQQNEDLKHRLELEQITYYFTRSVADKNNAEDILWDVARNLIGKLGFVDCRMYLWNKEEDMLVNVAGYGMPGTYERGRPDYDIAAGEGVVGIVAQTKEAVIIPDTSLDIRYRKDEEKRLSEICVPILYENELIGVIDAEHPDKDFFTPRHLHIMTTIAALIASKIRSIESEENLQQKKLELALLNQQLTEMEMKALHAQMNPHFIFNCLNSIVGMIIYHQNDDASRYLNKFAQLIRENLDHSKRPFITLQQNIDYLHNYLKMEQIRFTNFEYEMKVDDQLDTGEIMIAPMLIQPLAENAIWHGLQGIEELKFLKICFSRNEDYLVCRIEDNGIGINKTNGHSSPTQHLSIGIENIKKRIELMRQKYNTECIITFTDKGDRKTGETGTIVTLTWKII